MLADGLEVALIMGGYVLVPFILIMFIKWFAEFACWTSKLIGYDIEKYSSKNIRFRS